MWSTGITSAAVARHVVATHGRDNVTLLYADTLAEDADNHRFSREAATALGLSVTRVADGRTPQQVNLDTKWLSNSRVAKCSHLLKIIPCKRWLHTHCDPAHTTLYIGLDWTEPNRVAANRRLWTPWRTEFPLTHAPYHDKDHWIREFRAMGVREPRMYRAGYPHANCAGGCSRAGQAQWARLLTENPDLFASWEQHEITFNQTHNPDGPVRAILRERRGGRIHPLPLTELRRRATAEQPGTVDHQDWGGCGCFTDPGDAPQEQAGTQDQR